MKPIRFKRKTYGRGRAPATREGWIITALYVAVIVGLSMYIEGRYTSPNPQMMWIAYRAVMIVSTAILIKLCFMYGEKPRWQRLKKKSKQ